MLSIRRQPSTTTKVTFAVIAFSIGLAGAAIFLSTNISKQNLERAAEQSQTETLPDATSQNEATADSGASSDTQGSNKTSPFGSDTTSSRNWWTQPSGSSSGSTTSSAPAASTPTQSRPTPTTGGSGGGATQTPPPTQTCVINVLGIKVCT